MFWAVYTTQVEQALYGVTPPHRWRVEEEVYGVTPPYRWRVEEELYGVTPPHRWRVYVTSNRPRLSCYRVSVLAVLAC